MQDESTAIDDGFGHWLAGFADGEGSFAIRRQRSYNVDTGFSMVFTIQLRADDLPVLEEIRNRTGLGRIYGPINGSGGSRTGSPSFQWTVNTKAEVKALVALFDRYPLRAKKANDYGLWREAVLDWCKVTCVSRNGRPGPARDWSRIRDLRLALMDGRMYGEQDVDVAVLPTQSADLMLFEEGTRA